MIFKKLDSSIIWESSLHIYEAKKRHRRSYIEGFTKSQYGSPFLFRKSVQHVSDDQISNSTSHTDSGLSSMDTSNSQQFLMCQEFKDYLETANPSYDDLELKYNYAIDKDFQFDGAGNTVFHLAAKFAKPDLLK